MVKDGNKIYGFGSYCPTPPYREIDFNNPSRKFKKKSVFPPNIVMLLLLSR